MPQVPPIASPNIFRGAIKYHVSNTRDFKIDPPKRYRYLDQEGGEGIRCKNQMLADRVSVNTTDSLLDSAVRVVHTPTVNRHRSPVARVAGQKRLALTSKLRGKMKYHFIWDFLVTATKVWR